MWCFQCPHTLFHVALQEERHDRASQASAAQQANSQKLKELNNLVKSTKRNDEKLREYRARKAAAELGEIDKNNDAASVFSESGPLPDSDEESDMEFTSFSVPDGSKPAPSGKVGRSKLPGGNKRPRTNKFLQGSPSKEKKIPAPAGQLQPALPSSEVVAGQVGMPPPPAPAETSKKGKSKEPSPNGRSPAMDQAFNKAQTLLQAKQKAFSAAEVWASKPRQRNVSQAATALENAAKKLSNDPSAGDLQAQLLALAEEATMAQAVFTRVRQSPTEFVKDVLNVQQEQFLISLEPPLVATII
eukprot:s1250_g16.t1